MNILPPLFASVTESGYLAGPFLPILSSCDLQLEMYWGFDNCAREDEA